MQETNLSEVLSSIKSSKSIIIVPGYGMATSRCHFIVGSLAKELRARGIDCRFCIHPVAGRLPGHMNVLLAEANVPYNYVHEMEKINKDFPRTDLVLVVGANDIVNPDAIENPNSVLAGMPVCEVWNAKKVIAMKRSKGKGYAAIENSLFYKPNCKMFFGDAKQKLIEILNELTKESGPMATTIQEETRIEIFEEDQTNEEDMSSYLSQTIHEIGIPKESLEGEKRVSITPTIARKLIKIGFRIKIEKGAGELAGFADGQYERAGCSIVNTQDLWENTEIIVKVRPPMENKKLGYHEANSLQKTDLLISYIYPGQNSEILKMLAENKPNLNVLALDCTPRITRAQKLDTLSSTTNLAGYRYFSETFHKNYFFKQF